MRKSLLFLIFAFYFLNGSSQNIDSLLNVINNSKTDSAKVTLLINKIIEPYRASGNIEKALEYYEKAKQYCGTEKRLQINLGVQYVHILIAQEKYELATDSINKMMVQAIKIKNIPIQANCLRTNALIKLYSGEYEKAAALYYDALMAWQETGIIENFAIGYSDLGTINYYLGHFDKAAMYWEKSISIYKIKDDKSNLASTQGNLALAYIELKNFYKAEMSLKEAVEINLKEKKYAHLASAYTNFCKLEYQKNNIPKAIEYNNMAMEYYLKTNNVGQLSNGYCNGAELARSIKKFDEALIYINKAFEYENLRENKNNLNSLYLNRAAIYYDIGKTKEAYEDLEQHIVIKDSLINSDNQKTISELEKNTSLAKKKRKINCLTKNYV